jgi:hypothetical protein
LGKFFNLDNTRNIFGHLEDKPFSFKRWINKNIQGILGTTIFHMFLLILFLIIKIHSFKEIPEHRIILDFSEMEKEERRVAEEKLRLTQAEAEYLDRLLAQQLNISNRASNIGRNIEEEISTENYVNRVEQELDKTRSEDWRKQQEEIQKKLNQQDFVPEEIQTVKEPDIDDYKGLTNISYEFLEPPVNRYKIYLPVPVYKCRGEGTVQVDITVDQTGRVLTSKAYVQQDFPDKNCMIEIAEKYASITRFEGMLTAPKAQKARIVYRFIKQ